MQPKSQVSQYFSQADKIKLYKELEKNVSLGIMLAMQLFDEFLGATVEKKKAEFEKTISDLNAQISTKELKDGYTPKAGIDYPSEAQFLSHIKDLIDAIPKPKITEEDMMTIAGIVYSRMRKPSDGKTPRIGIDFPSFEQIKQYIDNNAPLTTEKTVTKKININSDQAKFDEVYKSIKSLETMIKNVGRANRGKRSGSGDSIIAGSGVTITRIGGRKSIAAGASSDVSSGAGAPGSTPATIGARYIDTNTGNIYMAIGTSSSADWKLVASFA